MLVFSTPLGENALLTCFKTLRCLKRPDAFSNMQFHGYAARRAGVFTEKKIKIALTCQRHTLTLWGARLLQVKSYLRSTCKGCDTGHQWVFVACTIGSIWTPVSSLLDNSAFWVGTECVCGTHHSDCLSSYQTNAPGLSYFSISSQLSNHWDWRCSYLWNMTSTIGGHIYFGICNNLGRQRDRVCVFVCLSPCNRQ